MDANSQSPTPQYEVTLIPQALTTKDFKNLMRAFELDYIHVPVPVSTTLLTAHIEVSYRKFKFDVLDTIQNASLQELQSLITKI